MLVLISSDSGGDGGYDGARHARARHPTLGCQAVMQKIKAIEEEMAGTQKNKATEYHLGKLKAKLAVLRSQLISPKKHGSGEKERGFEAGRHGDARVALIGFPSVGKSTFLNNVTETKSRVAAYEFTTLTCIPGVFKYNQAEIQILDLPGIIEGAAHGVGKGKQVIASARTADLIVLFMDAARAEEQKQMLEHELELMGIRLNQHAPDVQINKRTDGRVAFTSTHNLEGFDKKLAKEILADHKIKSAEVLIREKDLTIDQFIDVVSGDIKYIRALFVVNKIDSVSKEKFEKLAKSKDFVVISCNKNWNMDGVKRAIYDALTPIRVYTKRPRTAPDLSDPMVLCNGRHTVADLCRSIHSSLADPNRFYYAKVWGTSAKFKPQRCGLSHVLQDEDVVQIMLRLNAR